jgi:hypothetical protein
MMQGRTRKIEEDGDEAEKLGNARGSAEDFDNSSRFIRCRQQFPRHQLERPPLTKSISPFRASPPHSSTLPSIFTRVQVTKINNHL